MTKEMLTEEVFKKYQKAGQILKKAKEKARKEIKVEQKLLNISKSLENFIVEEGAKNAFPVTLGLNEIAAHFTSSSLDENVLEKGLLKVDIGTHVDGYIADAAITLDFSEENGKLIEAAEEALQNALSVLKIGVKTSKIGEEIENTIKKHGFKPIENLSGHGLEQYIGHSWPTIPNINNNSNDTIEDGMVFAIEPFASTGEGRVREGSLTEIFSLVEKNPTRNMTARKILDFVEKEYHTLAFAERWIEKEFSNDFSRKIAIRELVMNKSFQAYPVLKEIPGSLVSQAETTIVVFNEEIHILV